MKFKAAQVMIPLERIMDISNVCLLYNNIHLNTVDIHTCDLFLLLSAEMELTWQVNLYILNESFCKYWKYCSVFRKSSPCLILGAVIFTVIKPSCLAQTISTLLVRSCSLFCLLKNIKVCSNQLRSEEKQKLFLEVCLIFQRVKWHYFLVK